MKIQDNREENGEITISVEISDSFSTFGGEYYDGDYEFKEYGLDMGEVSFYNLSPEQYKNLGLSIINHLIVNGYNFGLIRGCHGEELIERA